MRDKIEHDLRLLIREFIRDEHKNLVLEKEFQSIFEGFYVLSENGRWTDSSTYEWDLDASKPGFVQDIARKTRAFIEKLPKDKAREYFIKFLEKIKSLPRKTRKDLIASVLGSFLALTSISSLMRTISPDSNMAREFREIVQDMFQSKGQDPEASKAAKPKKAKKSSFMEAQSHVKISEAGYSSDRKDTGNWIEIKGYGKRFVGSKYGISAPVLAKHLGKAPKAQDMKNLSYSTALKIFKKNFWDNNNLEHFSDQSVANILYDGCVNQGIYGTRETLIKALSSMGVNIGNSDNPFSLEWIKVANKLDQKQLFNTIKTERSNRYKSAGTFDVHGKGWLNRLDSIQYDKET